MSEDLVINKVRSYTSGVPGRCLNTVRQHHFVVDDPSMGEAMTPAEHFVSGISACAVNLIQLTAQEKGVPLGSLAVDLEAVRLKSDTSRFERVEMRFDFKGVTQDQADQLVEEYTRR